MAASPGPSFEARMRAPQDNDGVFGSMRKTALSNAR
jgi:hypothetical protein